VKRLAAVEPHEGKGWTATVYARFPSLHFSKEESMRTRVTTYVLLTLFAVAGTANAQTPATDTTDVRVIGGLMNVAGATGFLVSGGVGFRPLVNKQMEIQADGGYGNLGGTDVESSFVSAESDLSLIQVSGNFLYNFRPRGERKVAPFGGGGLVYNRANASVDVTIGGISSGVDVSSSDTAVQLLGGIDVPAGESRSFRAELRLQFFNETAVLLLAGISF
jgi:hypothetical protein